MDITELVEEISLTPQRQTEKQYLLFEAQIDTAEHDPPGGKSAVLTYEFLGIDGTTIEPIGPYVFSKALNAPYFYLGSEQTIRLTIEIPPAATRLRLAGRKWRSKQLLLSSPPAIEIRPIPFDTEFPNNDGTDLTKLDDLQVTHKVIPGTTYHISLETEISKDSAQGIITFHYYDKTYTPCAPSDVHPVHEHYGPYEYIFPKDSSIPKEFISTAAPDDADLLVIRGRTWRGPPIYLTKQPTFQVQQEKTQLTNIEKVREFANNLGKSDRLIIVYTTAGPFSASNHLILRSNRISLELSKAGWNVIYFPFSTPKPHDPLFPHERLCQLSREFFPPVLDILAHRKGKNNVFLCSSFSDLQAVGAIDRLHHLGWKIVYEIRDDMEEFKRVGYSKWYNPILERRIASRADQLIATSPWLMHKVSAISGSDKVHLIPNAAPDSLISAAAHLRTSGASKRRASLRKLGYIGHLTASWFDWTSLINAAQAHPDVTFEIVGSGLPQELQLPFNILYLGPRSHTECLEIVSDWSAGLIPFTRTRLTHAVDPNKAYEYVAMGLRTISSPMGNVEAMPGAYIYRTQEELENAIRQIFSTPLEETTLREMNEYVKNNSWSNRVDLIENVLAAGTA